MAEAVLFGSWEATDPQYGNPPVGIERLKAQVSIGTFVLIKDRQEYHENECVPMVLGRIVSSSHESARASQLNHVLELNIFKDVSAMPWHGSVSQLEHPDEQLLLEVVQTKTRKSVLASDIQSIAFVFTPTTRKAGHFVCDGISICFITRFREDKSVLNEREHPVYPFPSMHEDHVFGSKHCYASRLWKGISILKQALSRIMNRYAQAQGDLPRSTQRIAFFPDETWAYLLSAATSSSVGPEPETSRSSKVARTISYATGLKRSSESVKRNQHKLRFETEEQLSVLRGLLGHSSTFGIRKRHPKLSESDRPVENDAINVVAGGDEVEQPFNRRTVRRGVDLTFDNVGLSVSIRYEKYLFHVDSHGKLVNCPSEHVAAGLEHRVVVLANRGDDSVLLVDDAYFTIDGVLYMLRSWTDEVATAEWLFPVVGGRVGSAHNFTTQEVRDAITAYNIANNS